MWGKTRGLLVVASAIALVAAIPSTASANGPSVDPGPAGPARDVIVVLRNQHTNLPSGKGTNSARAQANRADQASAFSFARAHGVKQLHGFNAVNEFAATVTPAQQQALAADPAVAAVFPDLAIKAAPIVTDDATTTKNGARPNTVVPPTSGTICPSDPAQPQLEPEALQVTNTAFQNTSTPQAQNIVNGTGVKVAFIADGLDVNNPDFIRANGQHVFVDYKDFSGDGPNAPTGAAEAFGDASAIAAQGRQTYDISNYVTPAHPLPAGCNINVRGVAPGASLIGLKVFGNAPTAPTSRFIQAIDYAISSGADVLNESFGGNPFPDTGQDPISLADAAAIAAGVTVVSSTGDAGTNGTIGSPASNTDDIIGVGASTTLRIYQQEKRAGAQFSNGTYLSNNISSLSSGGVTQDGKVPDLVAPGDLGWALCTPDQSLYTECNNNKGGPTPILEFGGTSQSSPLTAGAAALVIEAYENAHNGTRPAPGLVKQILTNTATDLGHPAAEQGAGLLNSLAAVQLALTWPGTTNTTVTTNDLVANATQLALSGKPGQSLKPTVTITNDGATTQTVTPSTRSFENVVATQNDTVSLDTNTSPTFVDFNGVTRGYVEKTFTVGSTDRLDVSWAAQTGALRLSLIDPTGAFAAYSLPQGTANFGHVDVRGPAPGTWTALYFASQGSFSGVINESIVQTNTTTHGTVKPASAVLAPGASQTFTLTTKLPKTPSDVATSLQIAGSGGALLSIPVVLRADIVPTSKGFTGTITGGNGRSAGGPAQSNFYYVNVPKNKKVLSIGFTFSDPGQIVFATLMAPNGQTYAFQSNVNSTLTATTNGLQIYRRTPEPGIWKVSLDVTNPVSGNETAQTFKLFMSYSPPKITAKLPKNAKTKLAAGTPVTIPVKVTNNGTQELTYFADPRLNTTGTLLLDDLSGNEPFPLPQPPNIEPFFLVPTESNVLQAVAAADQPVNLDFFYQSGNPDVYGAAVGNAAGVTVNASEVTPGIWGADLGQNGPFNSPAPAGTANVQAAVNAQLFDPAVATSTGNIWEAGVDPVSLPALAAQVRAGVQAFRAGSAGVKPSNAKPANAHPADTPAPLVLEPGQTGTITVTITPSGATGSVVQGTLYIDGFDNYTDAGNELVALPYEYTIS